MDFLHGLALFLLCVVGYAGAAVATSGERRPRPGGWELALTAAAGLAAATIVPGLAGPWLAFPAAAGTGAVLGASAALLRRAGTGGAEMPDGGRGPLFREPSAPDGGEGSRVRAFLLRMGDFQGRITMGWLYFFLLAPFALLVRLRQDPLSRDLTGESFWAERGSEEAPGDGGPSMSRQH